MFATDLFSDTTVRFALLGLATGSLTALVALGVVIGYRASGVLNFAAASLGGLSAFVCYSLRDDHGWPSWLALLTALSLGALLGAGTYVALNAIRHSSLLTKLIATLALLTGGQGLAIVVWGNDVRQPRSFLPTTTRTLTGKIRIGEDRLILIGLVVVLAVVLGIIYTKTRFGLATSAVAESRRVAASAGWSPRTIELVNFVAAGVLSALAAVLLAPIVTLNAGVLSLVILPALAAALVGGFRSFTVTVLAALLIGMTQTEVALFLPEIGRLLGTREQGLAGLPTLAPLIIILVYIVATGRRRLARGETLVRLPLPGTGRVSIVPLVGAALIAGTLLFNVVSWRDAFITTLGMSIVICSVVVVSGYAGQLSLCQFALGGFGAWVASRLAESGDLGFELSVLVGVAATVLLGVVVALPALRTRGINLAIATLALALMIDALVFRNSSATGGIGGVRVPAPKVFGLNVDPVTHPERYGVLLLVVLLGVGLVVASVRRGRVGRRMIAVRSNERAAAALGISVSAVKLYAFALAAAIAALGGALLAFRHQQIQFSEFEVFGSILLVQLAVLGGIGWVSGAVAGAIGAPGAVAARLVTGVWPSLGNIASWIAMVNAFGLILLIRTAPDGIASMYSNSFVGRISRRITVPRLVAPRVQPDADVRAPAVLQVCEISVRFGGVQAVDEVSFEVSPGEIVGLIGPNGAGKTSVLDAVSGFAAASQGCVRLDDVDITHWSPERRARHGLARSWQSIDLFEEMTVLENLLVGCDRQQRRHFLTDLLRPGRQDLSAHAATVIDELGLQDVLDQRPSSLPQGHARLVGIARAIVGRPRVLLLDEPAAGLGPDESAEFASLIRRVAERTGIGVLVIEHDVPLLLGLCDRIVAIDVGRVIATGTPAEISADEEVIRAYLGTTTPDAVDAVVAS